MQILCQLKDHNDKIKGTGFLVSNDYLVSCAHVVNKIIELNSNHLYDTEIHINFPFLDNLQVMGKVIKYFPVDDHVQYTGIEDLVLLKLNERINSNLYPLININNHDEKFKVYGFGTDRGKWIHLNVSGVVSNGWVQLQTEEEIISGYSGSPVFSNNKNFIIGLIVAQKNKNESYLIPSHKIYNAFSEYINDSFNNSAFYNYLNSFNKKYQSIQLLSNDFFQSLNLNQNSKFYKFTRPQWADIQLNLDIKRDIQDEILELIFYKYDIPLILIESPSGEGKSTLLKRLAFETYRKQKNCYFIDANRIDIAELKSLLNCQDFLYSESILFVDNGFRNNTLFTILDNEFLKNVKIISTVQSREYQQDVDTLVSDFMEPRLFKLTQLSSEEKTSIAKKLETLGINYNDNLLVETKEWMSEFITRVIPENNFRHYVRKLIKELSIKKRSLEQFSESVLVDIIKYTALFYSYGLELNLQQLVSILNTYQRNNIDTLSLKILIIDNLFNELLIDNDKLVYRHEIFATYIKDYYFLNDPTNEIKTIEKLFELENIDTLFLQLIKSLLVKIFQLSQQEINYSLDKKIINILNLQELKSILHQKSHFSKDDYHNIYKKINEMKHSTNIQGFETCKKNYIFNKLYLKCLQKENKSLNHVLKEYTRGNSITSNTETNIDRKSVYNDLNKNKIKELYKFDLHILSNTPKANAINSFISLSYILGKEKRANFILQNTFYKTDQYLYNLLKLYTDYQDYKKVIEIFDTDNQIAIYKKNKYLLARSKLIEEKKVLEGLSSFQKKVIEYEYNYLYEDKYEIIQVNNNIETLFWSLALISLQKKGSRSIYYFKRYRGYLSYIDYKIYNNSYDSIMKQKLEASIPAIYYIIENLNKNIGSIRYAFYYIRLLKKILKINLYPTKRLQLLLLETTRTLQNFSHDIDFNDLKRMNSFLVILLHNQEIIPRNTTMDIVNKFLQNSSQTNNNQGLFHQLIYHISLLYKDFISAEKYLQKLDLNEQFTYFKIGDYLFYHQKNYTLAIKYYEKSFQLSNEREYKVSCFIKLLNTLKKLKLFDNKYKLILNTLFKLEPNNYLGIEYLKEYNSYTVLNKFEGDILSWLEKYSKRFEAITVIQSFLNNNGFDKNIEKYIVSWLIEYNSNFNALNIIEEYIENRGLDAKVETYLLNWLAKHAKTDDAYRLLQLYLDYKGFDENIVSYALTWLTSHSQSIETRYILQTYLDNEDFNKKIEDFILMWLKKNSYNFTANLILNSYISSKREFNQNIKQYSLNFLEKNALKLKSCFLISTILKKNELHDSIEQYALSWLNEYSNKFEASFVIQAYLENSELENNIDKYVLTWLTIHAQRFEASFVIQSFLERNNFNFEIERHVLQWLDKNSEHISSRFIIQLYIDDIYFSQSLEDYIVKWLDSYHKEEEASYIIQSYLEKKDFDEYIEKYTFGWLSIHAEKYLASFYIQRLLDKKGFNKVLERYILRWLHKHFSKKEASFYLEIYVEKKGVNKKIEFLLLEWLKKHISTIDSRYVLQAYLKHKKINNEVEKYIITWLHQFSKEKEATYLLTPYLSNRSFDENINRYTLEWLEEYTNNKIASYVIEAYLKTIGLNQEIEKYLDIWLEVNSQSNKEGSLIFQAYLEANGSLQKIEKYILLWCKKNHMLPIATYVFQVFLHYGGSLHKIEEYVILWLNKYHLKFITKHFFLAYENSSYNHFKIDEYYNKWKNKYSSEQ